DAGRLMFQPDQAIGVRVRQRLQQHAVQYAEHGRVRTDANGERCERDRREARRAQQAAKHGFHRTLTLKEARRRCRPDIERLVPAVGPEYPYILVLGCAGDSTMWPFGRKRKADRKRAAKTLAA